MNDSGYAYAKAAWIIGKSFLGKGFARLAGIHTINELDRLIFPDQYRELLGRELVADMETRIINRSVRQIISVISSYTEPPKLLTRMIKSFEYSDLKECFAHIAGKKEAIPVISDIGRFKTVRFENFPNAEAMLKKTEYESLLSEELKSLKSGKALTPANLTSIETKLDYRFYQGLIECLSQLSGEDQEIMQKLLADEISLRNCIWALRLRTYYQKTELETAKYLMDFKLPEANKVYSIYQKKSLAAEALKSLELPLDEIKSWRGWRWEKFLNPEETGIHWSVNPRYFQNAAARYMYHLAYHNFHASPMSVSAIFCFIKLKQFEEDLLTSVAEGLALRMDSSVVFKLLEVS